MVKPEQGKLGLDLQISVCRIYRRRPKGKAAPAGFPSDWALRAWGGDPSLSLLSRDDAFPCEMEPRRGDAVTGSTSATADTVVRRKK